ncbi:hypothetical protein A0256_07460 [Mucilaginibacter sp. PAMC 26640]|nr:hypothetical protein A0256_07460 [Mucilaginibacter sp. PAMC 26640]
MKLIRTVLIAVIIMTSFEFADASPLMPAPAETFQIRRPPPPPDPLHIFSKRPRRRVVRHRRGKVRIKLPPRPPAPPRPF